MKSIFNYKKTIAIFSILALPFLTIPSFSQEGEGYGVNPEEEVSRDLLQESFKEDKSKSAIKNCEILIDELGFRVLFYENNNLFYTKRYERVGDKLEELKNSIQSQNQSTEELEAQTNIFNNLVEEFEELSGNFLTGLEKTQEEACKETKDKTLENLDKNRSDIDQVANKVIEIKTHIDQNLKSVVNQYK
jgi:hypothetical protein